jgi:hypothetical protein
MISTCAIAMLLDLRQMIDISDELGSNSTVLYTQHEVPMSPYCSKNIDCFTVTSVV